MILASLNGRTQVRPPHVPTEPRGEATQEDFGDRLRMRGLTSPDLLTATATAFRLKSTSGSQGGLWCLRSGCDHQPPQLRDAATAVRPLWPRRARGPEETPAGSSGPGTQGAAPGCSGRNATGTRGPQNTGHRPTAPPITAGAPRRPAAVTLHVSGLAPQSRARPSGCPIPLWSPGRGRRA